MNHIPLDFASHLLKVLHDLASAMIDYFGGTDFFFGDLGFLRTSEFWLVACCCHSPSAFDFPHELENLCHALISPLAGILHNFSISCYNIVSCGWGN